jgi:hypothetical protein
MAESRRRMWMRLSSRTSCVDDRWRDYRFKIDVSTVPNVNIGGLNCEGGQAAKIIVIISIIVSIIMLW